MANNANIANWNFQVTATTVGNGFEYSNYYNVSTINFEITGTATSSTVIFEGKSLDNGAWYPIQCANLSTLSLASQTTGKNELWQVDMTGITKFRTRISSIVGGNINISGKGVG